MKKQIPNLVKGHDKAAIPHDFRLNAQKSYKIGQQMKTKSGLIMLATENKYMYECKKCDSAIETPDRIELKSLNIQIAERFTCV